MRVVSDFFVGDGYDDHIAALTAAQRVAVGRRLRDHLQTELPARARPVVDGELLAEFFACPVAHQPRQHITRITGPRGNNHTNGFGRIRLRVSRADACKKYQ